MVGQTKQVRKWEIEITDFYDENNRFEIVVRTMKKGDIERYWISANNFAIYMLEKYPIPQYVLKEIAKMVKADKVRVLIEDDNGNIINCF